MSRALSEHDVQILAPKVKALSDRDALADFARTHFWCQVCGLDGVHSLHHIIGGRGGRSDEPANLLMCCWETCHSQFADHSRNLAIVLTMKLRAGELDEAARVRLKELHGRNLPDLAPIPADLEEAYRLNRGVVRIEGVDGVVRWVPEGEVPKW